MFKSKFQFWWVAISLCLVTFLSRAPITSINAIVMQVSSEYHLSATQQGIILSLPTFVIAFTSGFIDKLDRKIGVVFAIFLSVVIIFAGFVVRDIFSQFSYSTALYFIYLGIIMTSFGITIMSVLYPAFINGFFRNQMGVMSSINATNLSISALTGTVVAFTMVDLGYTWRDVGFVWMLITMFIIWFYIPTIIFTRQHVKALMIETKQQNELDEKLGNRLPSMWTQFSAWSLAFALGFESASFYFVVSWYPIIVHDSLTTTQLSTLINLFQIVSIPFSFLAPALLVKYSKQSGLIILIASSVFALATIGLLLTLNYVFLLILFALYGGSAGILISSYMTLISLKTERPQATSKLSSMSQAVAYFLTAVYLLGFGFIVEVTGSFMIPVAITIVISLAIPVFSYFAAVLPVRQELIKKVG